MGAKIGAQKVTWVKLKNIYVNKLPSELREFPKIGLEWSDFLLLSVTIRLWIGGE